MGIVDDLNAVPRFAFHPFSRVKGRYIPPIFFSWISEKKKKKKKKSFDQLQSTLKKIQQRYVHVGENRLRLYDEVIPTLSALHVSPTVSLFNFFFSPLIISVPEIDSQAASSSFFFPSVSSSSSVRGSISMAGSIGKRFTLICRNTRRGRGEIQIRQAYTCYYPVKLTFMDALLSTVRTFVLLSISWWVQPKINGCSRQETSRRH